MSDSPKRLVKDKYKKKSYKKSNSFSSLLGRKDKDKRSVFEEELEKIGSSQFSSLSSEGDKSGTSKLEDLSFHSSREVDFSSEDKSQGDRTGTSKFGNLPVLLSREVNISSESKSEIEISEVDETVSDMSFFNPIISAPAPAANPADAEIMSILRTINVDDVLKASTLDIMSKSQAERREIIIAAVHCMCNGPVGVNKITNFPLIDGERSIKSMIDCSNRTWKAFCLHLINDLNFNCSQKCYTKDEFGDLWPVCESAMKIRAAPY